jgi:Ceramidase
MAIPFPSRVGLLVLFCVVGIGGYLLTVPPFEQPLEYHNFADQRTLLGVPHMLNVVSNLPFLIVGVWGLMFMASRESHRPGVFLEPSERWPFWVFFVGLALTGIGSAYYHAYPTNDRLTWDRTPLTVAFMGLFTAVMAERLSWQLAGWLIGPMVALGVGSVVYWHVTELHDAGDLRFYFVIQFFPMLALPILLLAFRPRYTGTADLVASLTCYVLAKILEILDREVYAEGGLVSGHTLKHLMAGLSAYFVLFMLQRRRALVRDLVSASG